MRTSGTTTARAVASLCLLAIGLAATAWFMDRAAGTPRAWAWPLTPLYLWAVSPLVVTAWLAARGRRRWLVVMAGLTAASGLAYAEAVVLRPDPQGGLVFLFLPGLMYAAVLAVALVTVVLDRVNAVRERDTPSSS